MAEDVGNLVVKLALDNSGFQRGIQNMNREIRKATSEFKNSIAGTDRFENSLDKLEAKSKMLTKQIDAQSKILESYKNKVKESTDRLNKNKNTQEELLSSISKVEKSYKESIETNGENAKVTKDLKNKLEELNNEYLSNEEILRNNVRTLENYEMKSLNADTKLKNMQFSLEELNKEIEINSNKFTQASKKLEEFSEKTKNVGSSLSDFGSSLSKKITAPITAISTAAIKVGKDLNKELANISTLIPGDSNRLNELKKDAQEIGIMVGKNTKEITSGIYDVISAYGDAEDTAEKVKLNAMGARAGIAETEDALKLTSAVMKGFGDTSAEANEKVLDLAFGTIKLGQTSFKDLSGSIGKVVPQTNELKISQEELFAVFATGTGVTGNASEVSTQYKGVLKSLMAPTKNMKSLMDELGVADGEAMIAKYGLVDSIKLITDTAKKSGEPLQSYIGSIEGQTLALALSGTQYDVYNSKLKELQSSQGAMKEAFNEQTQGINKTSFSFEQGMQKMRVAGENLRDAIAPILEIVANLFNKLADTLMNLSPEVLQSVAKIGLLTGALGPVISLVGKSIKTFGSFISKVSSLSAKIGKLGGITGTLGKVFASLTSPIGIAIASITALIAITVSLYKTNDEFREKINSIWNNVKDIIGSIIEIIKEIIKIFVEFFEQIWNEYGDTIIELTTTIFNTIADIIKSLTGIIKGIIGAFIAIVKGDWEDFGSALKTIWENMWNGIKAVVEGAWDLLSGAFSSLWTSISSWFEGKINDFKQFGKNLIEGLGEGISSMTSWVSDKVGEVGEAIKTKFKNIMGIHSPSREFKEYGLNLMEGLGEGIDNNSNIPKDALEKVSNEIKNIQNNLIKALKNKYTEQFKVEDKLLNKELTQLDNWKDESIKIINSLYDKKISKIKESSNIQVKALQDELNNLDKAEKEKSRKEIENDIKSNINKLRDSLEYEHNEYNKQQIEKQIEKERLKLKKQHEEWALDDKKEKLSKQIELIQQKAKEEIELLEEKRNIEIQDINYFYEVEKEDLEQRMENNREFLEQKTDDYNLQLETEKMMLNDQQEDMLDLLKQYEPHYEKAGYDLGQKLVNGVAPQIQKIIDMVNNMYRTLGLKKRINIADNIRVQTNKYKQLDIPEVTYRNSNQLFDKDFELPNKTIKNEVNIYSPKALNAVEQRRAMNRELKRLSFEV